MNFKLMTAGLTALVTVSNVAFAEPKVDAGLNDYAVSSGCLLYTSPSPRDVEESRMPSSA